ncbi:AlpA family phage regulatory protein [Desulfovibrio sp. OttesenSCG-928-G11]|nr:AlpA family phage regulatory protein [Desulfovibrio sp. OttesenSCG-928-G11]
MRNFDPSVNPIVLSKQERLLRIDEVRKIIPLSRPTIYRRIQEGKFPAPLKDGRCSLWEESKVRAYADQLVQQPQS